MRHGETLWNRERRFQGQRDSPLTGRGIAQMLAVGACLRRMLGDGLDAFELVASPLGRAWQSAVLVAEAAGLDPLGIRLEPLVQEISWGSWDGLTAAEIEAREPELWRRRLADAFAEAPPNGGESRLHVLQRARRWLSALPAGARILLVSHGTFGRALRCAYRDLPHASMLEMDAPQTACFHLVDGREERIEVAEGEAPLR
ncbi:Phosphoserine phosphatase 1 [bacterium HR40]|nr:Phosphoserine phosphatase 1 [bacterium HR40]